MSKTTELPQQDETNHLVSQRYARIRQIIEQSLSSPHDTGTQRINYSDDDLAFGKAVHIHEWSYHGPLPTSPFYQEFENLIEWGRSRGLNIQFEYQQDEFQVDRWYDIHVYPL